MRNVIGIIFAGIDRVNRSMRWPGFGLLVIMVLITNFEVVMRYFINKPTMWTLESTQMLQVVFAMIISSWVLIEEKHVSVDIIPRALSARQTYWLLSFTSIFGFIYCSVLVYLNWSYFLGALRVHERFVTTFVPTAPVKIMLALGFALLSIQFLSRINKYYLLAKRGKSEPAD